MKGPDFKRVIYQGTLTKGPLQIMSSPTTPLETTRHLGIISQLGYLGGNLGGGGAVVKRGARMNLEPSEP